MPVKILGVAGVQGNGQDPTGGSADRPASYKSGKVIMGGKMSAANRRVRFIEPVWLISRRPPASWIWFFRIQWLITWYCATTIFHLLQSGEFFNREKVDENARKLIKDFDVRTPSPYVPASKLSEATSKKVIVARELSRDVKLVIASQPTRGLDVGSIEYIHKRDRYYARPRRWACY